MGIKAGTIRTDAQKEYFRNWGRNWRKNPENAKKLSDRARRWQKANPTRNAINEAKKRSRAKGIPYELSDSHFEQMAMSDCFYCGAAASPINGIDRVDSAGGYVEGNVVPACADCNYAKRSMTVEHFLDLAKRIADYQRRRTF